MDQAHELCPGYLFHLCELEDDDDWIRKVDGSFISKKDAKQIVPREPNWRLQRLPFQFRPAISVPSPSMTGLVMTLRPKYAGGRRSGIN